MLTVPELWQMEMDQLRLEQGKEPDPAMWRWSPLDILEYEQMLLVAKQLAVQENVNNGEPFRKLSIAEAGSGIGTKLYLAKNQFELEETGFEINDEYLAKSAELGVNAIKYDLSNLGNQPLWGTYRIVYIARPFKDDDFEEAWENTVMSMMLPGDVLISAYTAVKPYSWPCYYRRPYRGVWVKPLPGKAHRPSTAAMMTPTVQIADHPGYVGLPA